MRAAKPSLAPRPLNAEYYAQRTTAGGLLIAEASPVTETGFGSPGVPGIYTEQQIAGWREVVDAVHAKGGIIFLQLWHVGRVSPSSFQPGGGLPVAMPLYTYAIEQLNPLGLAYLHFIEPRSSGAGRAEVNHQNVPSAMVLFRSIWKGVLITAGGFTGEAADAAIRNGHADAVAFGRIFISNPDLPRRLQRGFPLTPYNRATFYGGDAAGYTDYPEHNELEQA